jgi:hypothetical protein
MDLHTRAKNTAMAENMVGRTEWELAAAAAAAEDPPGAAPPAYLDIRPFVSCVVQTTALSTHFDPQNELLGSVRKRELGKIALGREESTTTMTVRLQQACHRVDELCAHPLTEFELKEHMHNILVKSTEGSIRQLALQIKMTPDISWLTVKRLVSRFDDTALGQERLA